MTPERYEQIGQLYDAALELTPAERPAFVESVCGTDEELRREVESLLEAHQEAGDFITTPALEMASELLEDREVPSLAAGHTISHYQVLSLLGAGGMGEVYLAQDTRLGRQVALKLLPQEFTADPERVRRFEREARAASALNHPNILTIHEIGEAEGRHFIATEFIEGDTLRGQMAKRRMLLTEALDVVAQVAGALEVAHAAGVVHRDLKPENIMVRRDGICKVLDFGLIKLTEQADPRGKRRMIGSESGSKIFMTTEPGLLLGTTQYMSPEQSRASSQVDHRTDLWSLGVVLYELVAGRAPFEGKDIHRRIIAIQENDPPPLTEYAGEVPERLNEIVQKALAKDPDERYQTARDLLIDLRNLKRKLDVDEELAHPSSHQKADASGAVRNNGVQSVVTAGQNATTLQGRIAQGRQTSSAEYIVSEISRHRRGFSVALAVFVLAMVGLIFGLSTWLSRQQPPPTTAGPPPKVIPFTSFPASEFDPSFSPDGNQIAFAWNGGGEKNFDIYVKLIGTDTPLRLTSHPGDDRFPVWSPDGRHIAFLRLAPKQTLLLIPALGGAERVLNTPASGDSPLVGDGLSWSPDGKSLAFSEKNSPQAPFSIYLVSLESLEKRKLTSPHSGTHGDISPSISPDGKTLAFIRFHSSTSSELYLVPSAGGEPIRVTSDNRWINSCTWTQDGREIVFASNRAGNLSLWRIPAQGGAPERLAAGGENTAWPTISRQGNLIAYIQTQLDTNIWRFDVMSVGKGKGGASTKLISSTREDSSPQFSPDGRRIAFSSTRSGNHEIWVCDADGSNPVQLTSFGGPHVGTPRWSPDGQEIAFGYQMGDHQDIYLVGTEGGKPRRLTMESSDEVRPSWSWDKRFIYFASNRSGDWQVWKVAVEGGTALPVTKQGGREAFESPDGKVVFYTKDREVFGLWQAPTGGGEEVKILDQVTQSYWAVVKQGIYFINTQAKPHPVLEFYSFTTSKTTRVATIEKAQLWGRHGLAVSSDGQRILLVQLDQLESDIMLVENFK